MGKYNEKKHDVRSFVLIVFSESPCVASLAAVATSRRGHFEKYINGLQFQPLLLQRLLAIHTY